MNSPHTYIIAEAGVNHNGSINRARALVDRAALAGVDAVKFQTFAANRNVSTSAPKAEYQLALTDAGESQYEMLKRLELSRADHVVLKTACAERGVEFLSTAFDLESIDLLRELGVSTWKVPSGEITNLPYLRKIGSLHQDVILSTGMATLGEIENALLILENTGVSRRHVTVLHCNTEYPTPFPDVNLRAMLTMASAFPGVRVGYSDHTRGIEVPIAAVALGAGILEKHFTLDRNLPGPDHRASLEPDELEQMVSAIRNVECALGDGTKAPSRSERKNKAVVRKSIVAARPIAAGELFSNENLTTKRPGTGVSPLAWDQLVGRKASRFYQVDEMIDA